MAVIALAVAAAATTFDRIEAIDRERAAWGDTRAVVVTARAVGPGEPVPVEIRSVPLVLVPDGAIDPERFAGFVARQRIGSGEIVTSVDVVADGPLALSPAGWLVVSIVESPPSGAEPGDRVQLASEGIVVAAEAIVAGHTAEATLVAVPADVAPMIPPAAAAGTLAVLRQP